jgi:hypothetical protein
MSGLRNMMAPFQRHPIFRIETSQELGTLKQHATIKYPETYAGGIPAVAHLDSEHCLSYQSAFKVAGSGNAPAGAFP